MCKYCDICLQLIMYIAFCTLAISSRSSDDVKEWHLVQVYRMSNPGIKVCYSIKLLRVLNSLVKCQLGRLLSPVWWASCIQISCRCYRWWKNNMMVTNTYSTLCSLDFVRLTSGSPSCRIYFALIFYVWAVTQSSSLWVCHWIPCLITGWTVVQALC